MAKAPIQITGKPTGVGWGSSPVTVGTGKPTGAPTYIPNQPVTPSMPLPQSTGPSPYETTRDDAIAKYKGADLGYNPYDTQMGGQIQGMNFDPYRDSAMNQADAGAAQGYVSSQAALQNMGDLSTSDRIQAINKFNSDKISGRLGAQGKYDAMQSQNQFDVGKFNSGRGLDVQKANIGASNEASRDMAQANLRRDENLWGGGIAERDLQRRLEAAKIIAQSQMGASSKGPLDFLFDPLQQFFPS